MQKLFRTQTLTFSRFSPLRSPASLNFSGSCWLALGARTHNKVFFCPFAANFFSFLLSVVVASVFASGRHRKALLLPSFPVRLPRTPSRPSSLSSTAFAAAPYLRPAINILALVHFFFSLPLPLFSPTSPFSLFFLSFSPHPLSSPSFLPLHPSLSRKPRRLVLLRARHVVFDFLLFPSFSLDYTGIDAPRGRFFFARRYPSVLRPSSTLPPTSTHTNRYHGLKS